MSRRAVLEFLIPFLKGLVIVAVILGVLALGATYMFMRAFRDFEPRDVDPRFKRAVEVGRIAGLTGVPAAVWPKPEESHDQQAPFVFFLVETNGGANTSIIWTVRVGGNEMQHFGGQDSYFIGTSLGKTRYLQKAHLRTPGETIRACDPYRGPLSIEIVVGSKRVNGRVAYRGDCDSGTYEFIEGAIPYDPDTTYWVCTNSKCFPIREGKAGSPEEVLRRDDDCKPWFPVLGCL